MRRICSLRNVRQAGIHYHNQRSPLPNFGWTYVSSGSKAERLRMSKCCPLCSGKRTSRPCFDLSIQCCDVLYECAVGLSALHLLARQHGPGREEPLAARARALVVVDEFEGPVPQLQGCDVG